jgi:hypothetical protein
MMTLATGLLHPAAVGVTSEHGFMIQQRDVVA